MTTQEFTSLEVGTKVYYFRYPILRYISSFNAAIGEKTIEKKFIMDDNGTKQFVCKGGGIITEHLAEHWFLTEKTALKYKIEYMKSLLRDKNITNKRKTVAIRNKLHETIHSKRVKNLMLEDFPEIFI